jgi:hypothetical protein
MDTSNWLIYKSYSELPFHDNCVRCFLLAPPVVSLHFNERHFILCYSFPSKMFIERSLNPENRVFHNRELRCLFQSALESREWLNIDVVLYNSCPWLPAVVQEEYLPELHDPCSQFCQMEERSCVVRPPRTQHLYLRHSKQFCL